MNFLLEKSTCLPTSTKKCTGTEENPARLSPSCILVLENAIQHLIKVAKVEVPQTKKLSLCLLTKRMKSLLPGLVKVLCK